MRMRKMGRAALDTSVLSIGAMRLPKDYDEAVALLRVAIDAGCNYIDTSRGYGESEPKLALALKDGYRDRVCLSTKASPWNFREEGYTGTADQTRAKIEDSMRRLEVDRLDYYQVWSIVSQENWDTARKPGGIVEGIHKAMDEGLVDHVGATTHAPPDRIREMIDSGLFETITVSYNLLNPALGDVIDYAAEKNVGVVVMNPMAGGALGCESPVIRDFVPGGSLTSRQVALKFVLDNPSVTCAISGISCMRDVEENVAAEALAPFTPERLDALAQAADAVLAPHRDSICTRCGYCMPCPQGVRISQILGMATDARLFGLGDYARRRYDGMKPEWRVEQCNECGACRAKCTNQLDVPEELKRAHAFLTGQGA